MTSIFANNFLRDSTSFFSRVSSLHLWAWKQERNFSSSIIFQKKANPWNPLFHLRSNKKKILFSSSNVLPIVFIDKSEWKMSFDLILILDNKASLRNYRTHIELYTYLIWFVSLLLRFVRTRGEKMGKRNRILFLSITKMCQIKFMSCNWRTVLEMEMKNWLVYYWSLPSHRAHNLIQYKQRQ